MKTRMLTALLALALPLSAQDASAEKAEAMFYKAFYLEKGARDFAGAMNLYEKFLAAAPEHKLAKQAAKQQYGLLDRTGKTKERDAFREKYAALIGNVRGGGNDRPVTSDVPGERGGRGARGERGERGGRGGFGNMAERLAEAEKALAAAKEAGDEEEVKSLTARIERMKQMAERGARGGGGERGERGERGGRRGGRGMFTDKKLAEMSDEEMEQFKGGLERMSGMLDRMRERIGEERAKELETNLESLNKALEGGKLDEAQKAYDKIRESMRRRRGGGGGDR